MFLDQQDVEASIAVKIAHSVFESLHLELHPDFLKIVQEALDKIECSVWGEIELIDEEVDEYADWTDPVGY